MLFNKRKFLYLAVLCLMTEGLPSQSVAQNAVVINKPVIDLAAIDSWSSVQDKAVISDDGKFILYTVDSVSGNSQSVIQAVDGGWRKPLGTIQTSFLPAISGRFFVYNASGQVVKILRTGTDQVDEIKDVEEWKKIDSGQQEYLVFRLASGKLYVRELLSGKQQEIALVKQFYGGEKKKFSRYILYTSPGENAVFSYDLVSGAREKVTGLYNAERFVYDQTGSKVVFVATDTSVKKNNRSVKSIWLYDLLTGNKRFIVSDTSSGLEANNVIETGLQFCADDNSILLLTKEYLSQPKVTGIKKANLAIWGYQDSLPQVFNEFSELPERPTERFRKALYIFSGRRLMYLENGDTQASLQSNGKYILVTNVSDGKMVGLVDAEKGSWTDLKAFKQNEVFANARISPDCKYVLSYDQKSKAFASYEIASGKIIELALDFKDIVRSDDGRRPHSFRWMADGKSLVFGYRGNLWLLDVTGAKPGRVISNGIGSPDQLFEFMLENRSEQLIPNKEYYVAGFNKNTKLNSFYAVTPDGSRPPRLLYSRKELFYATGSASLSGSQFIPLKAKNADVYLVWKMKATESCNFFTTKNFSEFRQQSFVYPEKKYNWLSTELLNCPLPGGGTGQGILYKPENFDPTKTYPVIMDYYESKSDALNYFITPERMHADANIPWLVSRGYLVLSMDIEYEIGKPGASANKYINAGADYLCTLPYVNKEKIGLFGHSFGGFETNYIVTHSTRFAAAVSSAGFINMMDPHGGTWGGGNKISTMDFTMTGQLRMGTTPWDDPVAYMDNSPVFRIDKIRTPMLIVHNVRDANVPVSGGIALFTSLRRCGKPAWLLQYDKAIHVIVDREQQTDYTNRVTTFFDHYLKGMPMPCWMSSRDGGKFKRDCED